MSATMPTGRPNARMRQTVGDMVRSLLAVLAVVAVIVIISNRAQPDPVREVSITEPLIVAKMSAHFPVLVPQGRRGYRLTSARWEATQPPVWHLGYVTPSADYVQVEQSASKDLSFISDQLSGTVKSGAKVIGSDTWTVYEGSVRSALVRTERGVTTAVSGTAPLAELVSVSDSLATQSESR